MSPPSQLLLLLLTYFAAWYKKVQALIDQTAALIDKFKAIQIVIHVSFDLKTSDLKLGDGWAKGGNQRVH